MNTSCDDVRRIRAPEADRNVMVAWQGDTVALCLGRDADDVARELAEQLRVELVRAGVDPSMIVLQAA
jgi:predicted RecB family endonuclease